MLPVRNRHITVLLSSLVAAVITFFITPTTFGMFVIGTVETVHQGIGQRGAIIQELTDRMIPSRYSSVAYDHVWQNGPLPAFTTPNYASLPVRQVLDKGSEIWTINTTLFEAALTCEPAVLDVQMKSPTGPMRIGLILPNEEVLRNREGGLQLD